jgi:flagellar biosynthesis protein FlhF
LEKNGVLPQAQQNPQIKEVLDAVKVLQQGIDEIKKSDGVSEEHPAILKIEQMLENNEFSVSYIKAILERLRKEFSLEELNNFEKVQDEVVKWIADSIQIKKAEYTARPQVIILVGPTGVGKTTTVAKIAASYVCPPGMNQRPKRVGIITVDSFRIAARQQIETYGIHMEVPVEAADNSEDLKKCLAMFSDGYDYILIDTIGYSPNDVQNIRKMRELLDVGNCSVATYLTMSASTKISDMRDIIRQYEIFDYDSVIVTKIDETSRIGNVISALKEKSKSVVYITTGQHVPRDFENATVLTFLSKLSDFKISEYINLIEN